VQGVLEGFATIGVVIALGFVLAHLGVLDASAQMLLSRLAFFVASPALMVTVLGGTDVADVFSRSLAASACGVAVAGGAYVALARAVWHKSLGDTVIGALSSAYVNAANLGIPISAYVLGDASLVAPMLLMQLVVLQPAALAVLDGTRGGSGFTWAALLTRPLRNPLTIGSLVGVLLSVTGTSLPGAIDDPLRLVGGMAVPGMLIAYGVSLRLGPLPGAGPGAVEIGTIAALKLVAQPLSAYLVARTVFGLEDNALLAVTVTAALPTAQNIFIHATRYDQAVLVARDAIFVTTVLSVPAIFVISALLA
jgi:malonate transporter and related proteins